MSEYYLEIHGVSKAFQAVQALDNVELPAKLNVWQERTDVANPR